MKYVEINKKFTDKVAEYLAKGYRFNTATMNGSQGEIAKVDLTDGKVVIRIVLEKDYGSERIGKDFFWSYDSIKLVVGIVPEKENVTPDSNDTWDTVWNNRLVVLECDEWYILGRRNNWYVSREEAIEGYRKTIQRYTARDRQTAKDITKVAGVAEVGLKYVKRQPRCKSAKLDLVKVVKNNGKFYVAYKDKKWRLG